MEQSDSRQTDVATEPQRFGASDFVAVSAEYGKTLRTWLVAYGVGGPILFLTQPGISAVIRESGQARLIIYLFLTGVALQIFLSLLNKWLLWYVSEALSIPEGSWRRIHRLAIRLHSRVWVDIVCDIGAVTCFGLATVKTLFIFT